MRSRSEAQLWNALTSKTAGPVVAVKESRIGASSGLRCCLLVCKAIDRAHGTVRLVIGGGRGRSRAAARRTAAFEAVERLALFESPFPPPGQDSARKRCPLNGQIMSGVDLRTGKRTVAGAPRIFAHPHRCYWSMRSDRPSSNGYAAGLSIADATGRAVLELIERDALMTVWRMRTELPTLSSSYLGNRDDLRRTSELGLQATFIDMSSIHRVPATICLLRGDGPDGSPISVIGSAADVEIGHALRRALVEAESVYAMCSQRVVDVGRAASEFIDFSDNAFYYLDASRVVDLDFLGAGKRGEPGMRRLNATGQKLVQTLTDRLTANNISVCVFDVTPSWAFQLGVRVVAARSDNLFPLELGRGDERLAARMTERPHLVAPRSTSLNLEPVPLA